MCPNCSNEVNLWDVSVKYDYTKTIGQVDKRYNCPSCGLEVTVSDLENFMVLQDDRIIEKTLSCAKHVPVLINYTYNGKRYEKIPDEMDLATLEKINDLRIDSYVPKAEIPYMHETHQRHNLKSIGIEYGYQLFTKRNLLIYGTAQRKKCWPFIGYIVYGSYLWRNRRSY